MMRNKPSCMTVVTVLCCLLKGSTIKWKWTLCAYEQEEPELVFTGASNDVDNNSVAISPSTLDSSL